MIKLKVISDYTGKVLSAGSRLLVCALVVLVSYSAISRYVFVRGIGFVEELSGLMVVGISLLSFGYVLSIGGHIRITLIINKLPKVARSWVELIAGLVGLAYSIIIIKLSWDFVYLSYLLNCHSPDSHIYEVPWMALLPIGMLALAIAILMFCIDKVHAIKKGEAEEIEEDRMKIEREEIV